MIKNLFLRLNYKRKLRKNLLKMEEIKFQVKDLNTRLNQQMYRL